MQCFFIQLIFTYTLPLIFGLFLFNLVLLLEVSSFVLLMSCLAKPRRDEEKAGEDAKTNSSILVLSVFCDPPCRVPTERDGAIATDVRKVQRDTPKSLSV